MEYGQAGTLKVPKSAGIQRLQDELGDIHKRIIECSISASNAGDALYGPPSSRCRRGSPFSKYC